MVCCKLPRFKGKSQHWRDGLLVAVCRYTRKFSYKGKFLTSLAVALSVLSAQLTILAGYGNHPLVEYMHHKIQSLFGSKKTPAQGRGFHIEAYTYAGQ